MQVFAGIIIAWLLTSLVFGFMARFLGEAKGYRLNKFMYLGFFLWVFGLLYVGFLPEEENQFISKIRKAQSPDGSFVSYNDPSNYRVNTTQRRQRPEGRKYLND